MDTGATAWSDATHGPGGGGGGTGGSNGTTACGKGGDGGTYGGGGGGGGWNANNGDGTKGIGGQGLLVFTYTPAGGAVQDTPELRGIPYGLRGGNEMKQLMAM